MPDELFVSMFAIRYFTFFSTKLTPASAYCRNLMRHFRKASRINGITGFWRHIAHR